MNATTATDTLASLCVNAVAAYIDACGPAFEASIEGLIATEAANWRTWRADGYDWPAVRAGLTAAWADRCGA